MNNNLKILTILSIFTFILTGYFYFSLSSVKNQPITHNDNDNDGEVDNIESVDKDKNKDKDKNNDHEEKEKISSKKSTLKIILFVIIFIIIIAIIITIAVVIKNRFKFKEDFKKENFCPIFYLINISKIEEMVKNKEINEIDDVKEDGDSFFDILAKLFFPNLDNLPNDNKKEIIFFLGNNKNIDISLFNNKNNKNFYKNIFLNDVLNKINKFAFDVFSFNDQESYAKIYEFMKLDDIDKTKEKLNEIEISNDDIDNEKRKLNEIKMFSNDYIDEGKRKLNEIKKKYGSDFDSYLCACLLYYFFEAIKEKINVKLLNIRDSYTKEKNDELRIAFESNKRLLLRCYTIKYDVISEILEKLLTDKKLENVELKNV